MNALVFNAGSTSLKFALFDSGSEPLLCGEIEWSGGSRRQAQLTRRLRDGRTLRSGVDLPDDNAAAALAIHAVSEAGMPSIDVVGHRVVHGGNDFCESVRIDARVKATLARLSQLAPLHNPPALKAIETAESALPGVLQVAVFDTAFYSTLPEKARVFPLPYAWYQDWGIRRFGFHGISHSYCVGRAAQLLRREPDQLRLISCHLGGGCSATAVHGRTVVATTMGFSPLDGLMMGSRCGSLDPGILLHLQRERGLSLEQMDHALNYESGLLGVSGVSADLAPIEAAAAKGNERAKLAFEMFADRVRCAIGSLAAALGGLDTVVFTDRIGEHSPALRASACAGLEFMGLRLDKELNRRSVPDCDVAMADSPGRILVIHTREELMVAREACRVRARE